MGRPFMFCSRCGDTNLDTAVYCQSCGTRLVSGAVTLKNPQLALFLSFLATGMGQFYNGQYFKGFFALVAYAALIMASVMMLIALYVFWGQDPDTMNLGQLREAVHFIPMSAWLLMNRRPWLFIGAPLITLILWIWGMVDAYKRAKRTNPSTIRDTLTEG
jgi:TM2 domain-containing membrane protein YozV